MNKKIIFVILFVIISLFPILSLFHSGLPITHDGQDHVARIANFYLNLSDGNFIPRWAANLNWGYGHPILEFLYPLPSYLASVFHFIGFSLIDSTKIVYGLGMILSFYFMFIWLKLFLSRPASLLGAVLYTYAPYRFVELYVRGDIGENLAFAFVPLVFFFIYKLYKKREFKYLLGGILSLALLILSHNAISLMFMPIIVSYFLVLIYLSKDKKSLTINFLSLLFLGLSISAFFWIPALIEGKYTLRNIVTAGGYINHFVKFASLIYGPWNYGGSGQFTVQLGVFQWFFLILTPILIYVKRANKQISIICSMLFLFTLFSIFLMLPISNIIWSKILLLQNFQFPWRFLAIPVFTTAVLGAYALEYLSKKNILSHFLVIITFAILILSISYSYPKGFQQKPDNFYLGIYTSTTDTGESAPIWSIRFMEHTPKSHLEIIDGDATAKELKRTSTSHIYQVTVNRKTLFAENTLYFPGWHITANGKPVSIEFQNMQYRGVMLFNLNKGSYRVVAFYNETKLREISDYISLFSVLGILSFFVFRFVKHKYS